MRDIKLISATAANIPLISALATKVWNQHYPGIIGQDQIDYMLGLMYSTESLLEQIEKKGHLFYLVSKGDTITGFISVSRKSGRDLFLNKFYIDQAKSSMGIGSEALRLLIEELMPSKITLTVNRKNYKSVNFYFKNDFTIEKIADIDIGNGFVMNDFIMTWSES